MASEEELDIAASEGFIDLEDKILFAQFQVSEEMKTFLRTTVGQFLMGRCKQIVRDFCDVAIDCPDPTSQDFSEARLRASAARMVMALVHEAISEGDVAESQLRQRDSDDGV